MFFRVKKLQAAMKGTSCVRRVRQGSFGSFCVFCNEWLFLRAEFFAFLEAVVADRIGMAA